MNIYSWVYGIGLITMIYLIYLIYKRAPKSDAKLYLILMALSAAIWIGSEFLYYSTWGIFSVVFYCLKYVGIITIPYAILMATLTIPIRSKVMRFKYLPHILFIPSIISMFFLFTNPIYHLFFTGFKEITVIDGHVRYSGIWGPAAIFWHVPVSYTYLLWGFINIIINLRKSQTKLDYYFLISLFLSMALPFSMNILILKDRNIYPDPTSLMLIFSAGQLAYVFSKYKVFQIKPASSTSIATKEDEKNGDIELKIENGKRYIVQGSGYSLLKDIVKEKPVLVLSIREPHWIRRYVNNEDIPVMWLSEISSEFSILPERLEFEIEYTIIEFWRQNPGGVVAIDGVGYLSAFNSGERLLMFLKDIADVSSNYDGSIIVFGNDLSLMDGDKRSMVYEIFNNKIDSMSYEPYSAVELNPSRVPDNNICISSENPDKVCPESKSKVWIKKEGRFTPDTMRIDVLYEIEEAINNGFSVVLYKPESIFIGWIPLKIYTYLKLIVDLSIEKGKKVYVKDSSSEMIRGILAMFL